jgi:phage/plasmid-associated DNA primase
MAVGGLQAVMRRGTFTLPPSVVSATDRFKMEADPMRGFIDECVQGASVFIPRMEFYVRYTSWAIANGFAQMSANRFYESLTAAAIDSGHTIKLVTMHGTRGFKGIELA